MRLNKMAVRTRTRRETRRATAIRILVSSLAAFLIFVPAYTAIAAPLPQGQAATTQELLAVTGEVKQELHLTAADWNGLPRTKITAKGEHDPQPRVYEGVLVRDLLAKAGVPSGMETHGHGMMLGVVATAAADNYHVLFSLGEIDSGFGNAQILVADRVDGQPFDATHGPLRLIVAGDKFGARWVRMLTSLTVVAVAAGN